MTLLTRCRRLLARPHLRLIALLGLIVPRRLRADWRQEWEAEFRYREMRLAEWDRLNWRNRCELLWRCAGAFWDAIWLQPRRLEDEMFQDVRYGVRSLFKSPGFTAVIVATLALGIGANAALFAVVNGVLLNPLPFPQPQQLVTLHQSKPNFETGAVPFPNFRDWQRENKTFSAMALSRQTSFRLTGSGEPERVNAQFITSDWFSLLGVKPALGRTFARGEDERGAAPVALIGESFWQRKFGSRPDAVGSSLSLDDRSYTIVGVIPASFTLRVNLFRSADVYVPIGQWDTPALQNRGAALALHGIGRIRPGVTIEQAQADLDRLSGNLAVAYPDTNKGNAARILPLKESMVGRTRPLLLLLLGAVGFVLLIACVNVSNLLLARSTGRSREFAIRAALGASRWSLVRQLLTESTLVAGAGGVVGLLLAGWGTRGALSLLPASLPRADEVRLDPRVLVFTLLVSLATGIVSGLAPALKVSRWRVSEPLKAGERGARSGRVRTQGVFVAVELALALVLLVGAGLMVRSLAAVWNVDPGFRPDNVMTFTLDFPPGMRAETPARIRAVLRDLSERLGSIPAVRAASFSAAAMPLQEEDDRFFWVEGRPKPATFSEMDMALVYQVEPGYLSAMGITLRQGRFFTAQDDERAQPVVVIDEVCARKVFGGRNPVGERIHWGGDAQSARIVGVVGHVKQWGLDSDDTASLRSQIYQPFRQLGDEELPAFSVGVVVRADGGWPTLLDSIRRAVRSSDAQNLILRPQAMNDVIADSLARRRFSMTLLNAFAVVALLLASIGVYGVVSYLVGQRRHELGVRLALGAQRKDVLRLVLSHAMKMALGGVVLGLVAAFQLTRLMAQMLYGVTATDPATFAAIPALLMAVALLACVVPARRATKVDPLVALREE